MEGSVLQLHRGKFPNSLECTCTGSLKHNMFLHLKTAMGFFSTLRFLFGVSPSIFRDTIASLEPENPDGILKPESLLPTLEVQEDLAKLAWPLAWLNQGFHELGSGDRFDVCERQTCLMILKINVDGCCALCEIEF